MAMMRRRPCRQGVISRRIVSEHSTKKDPAREIRGTRTTYGDGVKVQKFGRRIDVLTFNL